MASIQTTIELNDKMSAKLANIARAASRVQTALGGVQRATGTMETVSSSAQRATRALSDMDLPSGRLNSSINDVSEQVQGLTGRFRGLLNTIGAFTGVYLSVQGLQSLVDLTDQATSAQQRMSLIVGTSGKAMQAQKAIMDSANDSYSDYIDMSNQVAKLMMNAPNTFTNVGQATDFVNTFNKLGTLGGASVYESSQAMYQLTQSMAKGKLDGDELRSVMEGMPLVAKTIADSLGVDVGTMKEMAADGKVTAQVVRDALGGAMENVNKQFDKAYGKSKTFAMVWTEFKNNAISAVQPIMDAMNELWNSEGAESFGNGVLNAMNQISTGIATLIGWIDRVGTFVSKNWSTISRILQVGLGLVGTYIVRVGSMAIAQGIANSVTSAGSAIMNDFAVITGNASNASTQDVGAKTAEAAATSTLASVAQGASSAQESLSSSTNNALTASMSLTDVTSALNTNLATETEQVMQSATAFAELSFQLQSAGASASAAGQQFTYASNASSAYFSTASASMSQYSADLATTTAATQTAATTTATATQTASAGLSGVASKFGIIMTVISLAINAIMLFGGMSAKACGMAQTGLGALFGTVTFVGAAIGNLGIAIGITVANVGIGIANVIAGIYKNFTTIINNIVSAFQVAIARVQGFFWGLASTAATVIYNIAEALNRLPFVNFDTAGLYNAASSYASNQAAANDRAHTAAGNIKDLDTSNTFNYKKYNWIDTYGAYMKGSKAGDKLAGYQDPTTVKANTTKVDPYSLGNTYSGGNSTPATTKKIKGDTGKIAKNTEISAQQLAYLHDIAHRDAVNKYTTAEIKVNMTNNNKIDNTNNLEDIVNTLVVGVKGAQMQLAEGV